VIFTTVPAASAGGGILAHSLVIGSARWAKGRQLTAIDAADAAAAGIAEITVARLETGDTLEDDAAARIAAALAGPCVTVLAAAHGRVNLAAASAGVLTLDAGAVAAVNAVDEGVAVATLAPFTRVSAGEIVATVKIIPYAIGAQPLADACAAARPLGVAAFRPVAAILLQTRLPGTSAKALAKTVRVTRARIERLGGSLADGGSCAHTVEAIATRLDAIAARLDTVAAQLDVPATPLILIAGASATADRRDVVPAGIVAAGGTIVRLGMPVDPGNLLCLGALAGNVVIGLPGCARSPKRNGFDWVLERIVAGLAVTSADIAAMGVGGLLPEAERPQPRATDLP